jgi:hypothetical protein
LQPTLFQLDRESCAAASSIDKKPSTYPPHSPPTPKKFRKFRDRHFISCTAVETSSFETKNKPNGGDLKRDTGEF